MQQTISTLMDRVNLALVIVLVFAITGEGRNQAVILASDGQGNSLVELDPSRYAVSGSRLNKINWLTANVNGKSVLIYPKSSCQPIQQQLSSLSETELSALQQARSSANGRGQNGGYSYSMTDYSNNGVSYRSHSSSNNFNFVTDSVSIVGSDENNFSYSGPELPETVSKLIRDKDVVTFVYNDNQILMKPVDCLDSSEQQLLSQAISATKKFQKQMERNMNRMNQNMNDNMDHFHQNMDQFHQNMEQFNRRMSNNMNEMSRRMSQSFGNGFPFNNMNNNYGFNNFNHRPAQHQQQQYNYMNPDYFFGDDY